MGKIPCSPLGRASNKYSWVWILDSLNCQDRSDRWKIVTNFFCISCSIFQNTFLQYDDLVIFRFLFQYILKIMSPHAFEIYPDSNLSFDQPPSPCAEARRVPGCKGLWSMCGQSRSYPRCPCQQPWRFDGNASDWTVLNDDSSIKHIMWRTKTAFWETQHWLDSPRNSTKAHARTNPMDGLVASSSHGSNHPSSWMAKEKEGKDLGCI